MTNKERRDIEQIEKNLKKFRSYNDIPKKFIHIIDDRFSLFGYLKSLLEIKREEE